jgi:hypothetical protein
MRAADVESVLRAECRAPGRPSCSLVQGGISASALFGRSEGVQVQLDLTGGVVQFDDEASMPAEVLEYPPRPLRPDRPGMVCGWVPLRRIAAEARSLCDIL